MPPQGITPNGSYPLVVVQETSQLVPVALTIAELQPGQYTVNTSGSGAGIVTNALTGQLITASNPAHAGDFLVIYGAGLGALVGANGEAEPADGAVAPSTILYRTTAQVTATIGGKSLPVLFSGLTPTFAALYQVNVQVSAGVTPGNAVPIVITRMPRPVLRRYRIPPRLPCSKVTDQSFPWLASIALPPGSRLERRLQARLPNVA